MRQCFLVVPKIGTITDNTLHGHVRPGRYFCKMLTSPRRLVNRGWPVLRPPLATSSELRVRVLRLVFKVVVTVQLSPV